MVTTIEMNKLTKILLLLILIGSLLAGGKYLVQKSLQSYMQNSLGSYGFKDIKTGSISFKKKSIIYSDITLDPAKFSTIGTIQFVTGYPNLLLKKVPQKIIVDDVELTAEWEKETGLDMLGWKKKPLPYTLYQELILNSGKLDLLTAEGALRFQAKGHIRKQPEGYLKLQGALWGIQHQIQIETLWEGLIYPDGRWSYDVEFKNGDLKLKSIQASRMSGWFNINKTKNIIPDFSGQISSGKMNIGNIRFTNFSLSLNGPATSYELIAKAQISGYKNMTATLDVNNTDSGPQVNATIETPSQHNLLSFLTTLQNSDTDTGSFFTSLLLTQGNIDRLRRDIERSPYDMLDFQINGPLYDLAGKIVTKRFKDGVIQRNIISLDPGDNTDADADADTDAAR